MRQVHNTEYERALHAWVSSDVKTLVHYIFSLWQDVVRQAERQREIDEAQERFSHIHNKQYERALKCWATSDLHSLLHYCFVVCHDLLKEARKRLEIEEAQDRMRQVHN